MIVRILSLFCTPASARYPPKTGRFLIRNKLTPDKRSITYLAPVGKTGLISSRTHQARTRTTELIAGSIDAEKNGGNVDRIDSTYSLGSRHALTALKRTGIVRHLRASASDRGGSVDEGPDIQDVLPPLTSKGALKCCAKVECVHSVHVSVFGPRRRSLARQLVREKQVRGKCMPPPPVVIRCTTAHLFSDAGLVRPVALFEHNLSLLHALRADKHTCVSCSVGWYINNILQKKNGKMSIKSTLKVTPFRSLFLSCCNETAPTQPQ